MRKILIFVLAMVMLLSCVACSNTSDKDPGAGTNPPSDIPIELRPPVNNFGTNPETDKKPFDKDDPRKKYLEDKYGVTSYLVAEIPDAPPFPYSIIALEGYESAFRLYAKADLVDAGVAEETITTDYVDDAYFTIAYAQIYEYFAQAVKASGAPVDRIIIQYCGMPTSIYDPNKSFEDCLASTDNKLYKFFNLYFYGEFVDGDDSVDKLIAELEKIGFKSTIRFYKVLQDISSLTNDDLMDYKIYGDYVRSWKLASIN